jgi:hypothetical protein
MSLIKLILNENEITEGKKQFLFDRYLDVLDLKPIYNQIIKIIDNVENNDKLVQSLKSVYANDNNALQQWFNKYLDSYGKIRDYEEWKKQWIDSDIFKIVLLRELKKAKAKFHEQFKWTFSSTTNIPTNYLVWFFTVAIKQYIDNLSYYIFDWDEDIISTTLFDFKVKKRVMLTPLREDSEKISDAINKHNKYKNMRNFPAEYKDISKVKSLDKLYRIINKMEKPQEGESVFSLIQQNIDDGSVKEKTDYELLAEDDKWFVVTPLTEKGACVFGAFSNWCTSFGKNALDRNKQTFSNYFKDYKSEWLISFINKKDSEESYQVDFVSGQMKDYFDKDISEKNLQNELDGVALDIFNNKSTSYNSEDK